MPNKLILDRPSPELIGVLLEYFDAVHSSMKFDRDMEVSYHDGVSMQDMCDQYFDIKYSFECSSDSGDMQMSNYSGDKLDVLSALMRLSDRKLFPFES